MSMTEATPKSNPGGDDARARVQRVYLLIEIAVGVVLIGAILWFSQNHQPSTFLGKGLVDLRLWILVLLVSGGGTAASLLPYYVGQRGTEAVFEHYPRLEGRPWQRIEAVFGRWGAFTLVLSGIPVLGVALPIAAGAFGIRRRVFLGWAFLGNVLRYWVLMFVVLYSLQLVG
jgi:membrane protein YqaA with SNARE-associated domain